MHRWLANVLGAWLLVASIGWLALELSGGWYEYQVALLLPADHEAMVNVNGWEPMFGTVDFNRGSQRLYHYRRPRIRLGR